MADLTPIIEESFIQYSGAVLQSRALVDVRDCIKPAARQIFYCMKTDKFTADKPFRKTLKAIGSAMRMYIHGDSSCEGVIMRAGQPFAMRYPLMEIQGSEGNLIESGNWSAPRYTEARLSKISEYLFKDIEKNTITDWRDNYDDTEQYPAVLPSKGYYNICNGTFGIGIGASSSIPQFNIKDVNNALIKLIKNPNISDEELICIPDFATGAVLLNPEEVKLSLLKGQGKSCILRSVIDYDVKDNCLVVTEIPYSVYTNTICKELEIILEKEDNPGIDRFNDLTGENPLIKIYLRKKVNVPNVIKYLYKNTSLQYWFAINLTMLDNGRYPRLYTWKEALQAHINHEKVVYTRGYEFDREKAKARLHIVNGLLIALANIEEVIATIKQANSVSDASVKLQSKFLLDEVQTKAILEMKLSRLAHLEVDKLVKEAENLKSTIEYLTSILNDKNKLNEQIILGLQETIKLYGDERRTKIQTNSYANLDTEEEQKTEEKEIINLILDDNSILPLECNDKINLNQKNSPFGKHIIKFGYKTTNLSDGYIVNSDGRAFKINNKELSIGYINQVNIGEDPVAILQNINEKEWVITVTHKGIVKKSATSEYKKLNKLTQIAKLKEEDKILYVTTANSDEFLYILGEKGGVVKYSVNEIKATNRMTIGCKGIDDKPICATVACDNDLIFTFSQGKGKFTKSSEYNTTSKISKGQTIAENTTIISKIKDFLYIIEKNTKLTKYSINDLSIKGKTALGAKISNEQIIKTLV